MSTKDGLHATIEYVPATFRSSEHWRVLLIDERGASIGPYRYASWEWSAKRLAQRLLRRERVIRASRAKARAYGKKIVS